MSTWIAFRPLSSWVFRAPSPLEPGIHGPGVSRGSLSYPMPSTIAGTLASLACAQVSIATSEREFDDVRYCLSKLAGGSRVALRQGLALADKTIYAYIGLSRMPKLSVLMDALARLSESLEAEGDRYTITQLAKYFIEKAVGANSECWEPARSSRTGISVSRESKSVFEGMLYTVEEIDYGNVAVLVHSKPGLTLGHGIIRRFGGESGLALISSSESPQKPFSEIALRPSGGHSHLAILITPALMEESPLRGVVNPSSKRASEELGQALTSSIKCLGYSRVLFMPKGGEMDTHITMPGWSLARRRPRRPMLMIPAGTLIYMEAEGSCLRELVETGLGDHSDLGWGTTIVV